MNGSFPYTSLWIGSLGEYPMYEFIKNSGSNSSNFTINTSNTLSNTLESHSSNTSNILQTQIINTNKLIFKYNDCNTNIYITAINRNYPFYPLTEKPIELFFNPYEGHSITKINQSGELMVYHPATPLPEGFGPGWWGVENKIANILTETIGLRADVISLQVLTGTEAIT
jgi:hypothetical protein